MIYTVSKDNNSMSYGADWSRLEPIFFGGLEPKPARADLYGSCMVPEPAGAVL